MEKIYRELAMAVLDILPSDIQFNYVELRIKRLKGNVGFTGHYITHDKKRESLDIWEFRFDTDKIHQLYELTLNHPLQHKDWNRAKFTLYPTGKFDMEYIWDQELQDEVDNYNKEN